MFEDVIGRTTGNKLKRLIHSKTVQMRRFAQFEDMFMNQFNNHTLLLRYFSGHFKTGIIYFFRFYAYGCYCLNLGDRPLAGVMTGMYPVDTLDE